MQPGGESSKRKAATGVLVGAQVLENAAIVTAHTQVVFAAAPADTSREAVGVVVAELSRDVAQAAEVVEGKPRHAVIEGILRDSGDSRLAGDVQFVRVKIREID